MGKITKMLEKSGYTIEKQEIRTQVVVDNGPQVSLVVEEEIVPQVDNFCNEEETEQEKFTSGVTEAPPSYEKWDERLKKVTSDSPEIAEAFRMLRAKMLLQQNGRFTPRTIMVSSALPSEGKSFITANLGIALAKGVDQHCLLVDCDLRHPTLAGLFGGGASRYGLVDYLKGEVQLPDIIQKTAESKLSVLASGRPPGNPSELLSSARMHDLVDELSLRYADRFVIFDTPPLQVASESTILAQAVDGVILVVRQGVAGRSLIEKFIHSIGKEKILGLIFNGHKRNPISSRLVDKNQYYYGNYYHRQTK